MQNLFKRLKDLLPSRPEPPLSQEEVRELGALFKIRYHHFKQLLAANNRALDLMAEIDSALAGDRVFGMSFIRARCTALGVSVYAMIKNLDSLAPQKYQALFASFKNIQDRIKQILDARQAQSQNGLVVDLEQVDKMWADQVGGKMANLGEIHNRLSLPTPDGFVITASAQRRFFEHSGLQEEINRRIQATQMGRTDQLFALSSGLRQLVAQAELPPDLVQEVEEAYQRLEKRMGRPATLSLRSSALGEDAAHTSFAGQYSSQLNVRPENMLIAYREVVASKYSPQAMHYRYQRGLRDEDLAMCVGCLAMVDARAGGVAYTINPLDKRDQNLRITATWGLPKGVVDGNVPADLFVVSRDETPKLVEQNIAHKGLRFDCFADEGVCRMVSSGEEADRPCLDEEQLQKLAKDVLRMESHYGSPQDVEWALDRQGDLHILQCRPLMGLGREATPAAPANEDGLLLSGGVAASPGAASGEIFWVQKDSDALRFPPGAVLAISQTWPRWAALLGSASAIVAQTGNLAGHLATVAREYGLPAIFGLGDNINTLQNGDLVTVDAQSLAIYQGRVEALLSSAGERKNLMAGSPVHQVLKEAAGHITPLGLLDPDSAEFRPENCRTLHDITRFCHEKSVTEMFSFGKDHHFPLRSSKQLYYQVPMQYWIINLDDGFDQEVQGKYVKLENITSIPMLALWAGMIAIPWEGPPAVSGRGFASVMFQATTNPALATPFKTSYSNRNYFMISKHFLNLQSRFGFHFCTVEALVGERPGENYLSFSFAGGAADSGRRRARVDFVGDILNQAGFRVQTREDTLSARQEGLPQSEMEKLLKVTGYLLMHTRQLDMIMGKPQSVNHYRNKIISDLETLRAQEA